MQKEFKFVKQVEADQIKRENDKLIALAIKYQALQKKYPKYNRYLQMRINNILQKVR